MSVISLSVVSDSESPRTVAHQPSLSMGFSRQEYWSGLPFPSPEDLPDPGLKPWSPALQADSLPFELQGSPKQVFKSDFIREFHKQGGALDLLFGFRLWNNRFLVEWALRTYPFRSVCF